MGKGLVRISRFLSLVLRHDPGRIGLELDREGWASVADLGERSRLAGLNLTVELVREVVATSDKRRFSLSEDALSIRANQGHSIPVDLGLSPVEPPSELFHGTVPRFLESIRGEGLVPGSRQHVHLSPDAETAARVGRRRGEPVVLRIDAAGLAVRGQDFFVSANGVWLTAAVPAEFIRFP